MYDKVKKFTDIAHQQYGTHAYAAGYFSSMVSQMVDEMRIRGSKEMKEMADYYERLISKSIINIQTEGK